MRSLVTFTTCLCLALLSNVGICQPFSFDIPGFDSNRFRITEFASGLNFPVGMVELSDGSIAVLESNGNSFFGSSSGSIVQLTDSNGDGVSDARSILNGAIPGGKTSALRSAGDLMFATGQGTDMTVLAINPTSNALDIVAQIEMDYPPGGWLHPHSALAARQISDGRFELFFQLGSDANFATTTRTVSMNAPFGLNVELAGDALHRLTFDYDVRDGVQNATVTQVATGLRNAAGMAFHPGTGELYLQDNGIDGLQNANEPFSADEINVLRVGGAGITDFGFPQSYTEYRTGNIIGDRDAAPLVAFQPLGDPNSGDEAEGPNDISFGPDSFPLPLRNGLFVGMHGRFSSGGLANEENPLVFVDLRDNSYSHAVGVTEPNVGHLDGILATDDALYLADISPGGGFSTNSANTGVIYRIESLYPTIDEMTTAVNSQSGDLHFDLTDDAVVDAADRDRLITEINGTNAGDSNLDGLFDSSDLVRVFQINAYDDPDFEDVTWESGDWNGDDRVDSSDLIAAFRIGHYRHDAELPRAVPEPRAISVWLALVAMCGILRRSRCRFASN